MTFPAAIDAIIAREFPRLQGPTAWLNNAATGPLPRSALAVAMAQADRRAEPWRYGATEQFAILDRSRELVAGLIGASPGEIALAVNTSTGLNLAARSLPFARGDVIVGSDRDFPANVYPWMAAARDAGAELQLVPCRGRLFDEEALLAALDGPRVRALVVSWVSFESGMRLDLDRLGRACRERGIWFVVDAIQGLGPLTLDVRETPIDILACGSQKWLLSPWGSGFTYIRHALATSLEPRAVSWMSMADTDDFSRLLDYRFTWRDDARRFELITLPYQDFAVMNAALEVLLEIGPSVVAGQIASHVDRLARGAEACGCTVVTPSESHRRAGIVSVLPREPDLASRRLTAGGVMHSLREGAIRLSPHVFTPVAHLERALALLEG